MVSEVDDLGPSLDAMQGAMHRFLDTGRSLSSERDDARRVRRVLDEALAAATL